MDVLCVSFALVTDNLLAAGIGQKEKQRSLVLEIIEAQYIMHAATHFPNSVEEVEVAKIYS